MSELREDYGRCMSCRRRRAVRCVRDANIHRHCCTDCAARTVNAQVKLRRYRTVNTPVDACGLVESLRGESVRPLARNR